MPHSIAELVLLMRLTETPLAMNCTTGAKPKWENQPRMEMAKTQKMRI